MWRSEENFQKLSRRPGGLPSLTEGAAEGDDRPWLAHLNRFRPSTAGIRALRDHLIRLRGGSGTTWSAFGLEKLVIDGAHRGAIYGVFAERNFLDIESWTAVKSFGGSRCGRLTGATELFHIPSLDIVSIPMGRPVPSSLRSFSSVVPSECHRAIALPTKPWRHQARRRRV